MRINSDIQCKFNRLFATLLVAVLYLQIVSPVVVYAAPEDGEEAAATETSEETSEQPKTYAVGPDGSKWWLIESGQAYEHDNAATMITSQVTQAHTALTTAVQNKVSLDAAREFGMILIYANWLMSNGYNLQESGASQSTGDTTETTEENTTATTNYWYGALDDYVTSSTDAMKSVMNSISRAHSDIKTLISDDELLSGAISGLSISFFPDMYSAGSKLGMNSSFSDGFSSLISKYFDARIIQLIAEDNSVEATADAVLALFPDDYQDMLNSGNYDAIRAIVKGKDPTQPIEDKVRAYITALTELDRTASNFNGYYGKETDGLDDVGGEAPKWKYVPFRKEDSELSVDDYLSDVTKACIKVFGTSESPDNINDLKPIALTSEDLSHGLLENIANVKLDSDGIHIADGYDKLKLTDLGWGLLSCGVVYDPFISKAGDDTYLAVLDRLVEEGKQEDLHHVLKVALNTKKPLYVTEDSLNTYRDKTEIEEITASNAVPATLATLFHEDTGALRIYFMLKGTIKGGADSSTFAYVEGMSTDSSMNVDDASSGASISATEDGNYVINAVGSSATATYTSDQITRPVMFTAGRTRKLFSTTDTGMYNAIGGLTELILYNAKQDCSSLDVFSRAETEFLFVNGLGDVVLADGTMVLPAISNPILWTYSPTYKSTYAAQNGTMDVGSAVVAGAAGWGAVFAAGAVASVSAMPGILSALGTTFLAGTALATGGVSLVAAAGVGAVIGAALGAVGTSVFKTEYKAKTTETSVSESVGLPETAEGSETVEGSETAEGSEYTTTSVDSDTFTDKFQRNYYPYNAAFCNHYPALRLSAGDASARAQGKNVAGKYMLNQTDVYASVAPITNVKGDGSILTHRAYEFVAMPIQAYSFCPGSDDNVLSSFFQVGLSSGTGEAWYQQKSFSSVGCYILPQYGMSSAGMAYFPLTNDSNDLLETYTTVAASIVQSCLRYLTTVEDTSGRTDAGTANIELWMYDMVGQAMLGNQYAEQMSKNMKLDYESLVNDQYGRFSIFLRDNVASFADSVGHVDGVLSMKDGYGNGFFNTIMSFVQEFYLILCVVLVIIVAVKFLKGHYSFVYVAFIGLLTVAAFQVYAVWMPTAIPSLYNMAVNNIVEDVTWSAVTVSAEHYNQTYKRNARVDSVTGKPKPYTATVTLYKMTMAEMEAVSEAFGVDIKAIKQGDTVWLDTQAGIFVQGDEIKLSVDSLLVNNTMRGLYKTQWESISDVTEEVDPIDIQSNGNPYIVKLESPYVSLESYYTPYCQIERAFMVSLNNFANIFRIQRNIFTYEGGIKKDAFLFNAFTNSGIFLDPDSDSTDDTILTNINIADITSDFQADVTDIIQLCHQHMEPFADWLNLRSIFINPSDAMKESLWGRMLIANGYYNTDWSMTQEQEEAVTKLIVYINTHTKQFIIRNQDQLNFCSDENAIKLVSLYATTCFAHKVAQFGYWLYPNYINSSDIELYDVMYGALTTVKDRNTALNTDLVNTIMLDMGVPGLLLVFAILLFSVIFIFIITYLVPVLYLLFGFVVVFKLLNDEENVGMLKGYMKVTGVTSALYALYSFGLRFAKLGGYQWYGYLGCAIVSLLCVYFLVYVVLSVAMNPMEIGNDILARNLFSALDRLTGHRLSRLTTNSININANRSYGGMYGNPSRYMRRATIDGFNPFGMVRRRRGLNSYGRNSGYSSYDYSYDYGRQRGIFNRRNRYNGYNYGGRLPSLRDRMSRVRPGVEEGSTLFSRFRRDGDDYNP